MAGGKETPRQKMIGMMYLVLTALLALNVSKDILDAFVRVNKGLEATNKSFTAQNEKIYVEFENQNALNPDKVGPYYEAAKKVKELTTDAFEFVNQVKLELIAGVEGKKTIEEARPIFENVALITVKDNYDIPTNIMVGNGTDPSVGKARDLKNKFIEYKEGLLAILNDPKLDMPSEDYRKNIIAELGDFGINTDDPSDDELSEKEKKLPHTKWWETRNFYGNVVVATLVVMTNMQNDIRNAEARMLNTLLSQISVSDFKFDQIAAKVVPYRTYIMTGDKYSSEIFVAAYSTTQQPIVYIKTGVDTITAADTASAQKFFGEEGLVKYEAAAGGIGDQKYAGLIAITGPLGNVELYSFKSGYSVGKPSATVSADAMNVFYIGLDNPITVSVPGAPAEKVNANVSPGSLVKTGPGKWNVRVPDGVREVTVSVTADLGDGNKSMGSEKFRVRRVPNPTPVVARMKGGAISKNALKGNPTVGAILEDFLFEGVQFVVTRFTFTTVVGGESREQLVNGNQFNQACMSLIDQARSGQRIMIESIQVRGPGGALSVLPSSVVLKII